MTNVRQLFEDDPRLVAVQLYERAQPSGEVRGSRGLDLRCNGRELARVQLIERAKLLFHSFEAGRGMHRTERHRVIRPGSKPTGLACLARRSPQPSTSSLSDPAPTRSR